MSKPLFFEHENVFYNFNHIVKFETRGVEHIITLSNGDTVSINTGHLKFEEFIHVANPSYGGNYKAPSK